MTRTHSIFHITTAGSCKPFPVVENIREVVLLHKGSSFQNQSEFARMGDEGNRTRREGWVGWQEGGRRCCKESSFFTTGSSRLLAIKLRNSVKMFTQKPVLKNLQWQTSECNVCNVKVL